MLNTWDVKIDTNLSWQYHVNDLSIKLNRTIALSFKMKKYVSLKILRSIYFRTTKLVRLLLESLNAFAESPETLRTRQKLLRNSKILKDITKNRSVMVKGEKVSISLRQNKMI